MIETIGKRIAQARKHQGWTQRDLACRLGRHDQQISVWERGLHHPQVRSAMALAHALEVSFHWLWSGRTELQPPKDETDDVTIGTRIARARALRGWDAMTLAGRIGKPVQQVLLWETDRRKPQRACLHLIAEATDTTLKWLRFGKGDMTTAPARLAMPDRPMLVTTMPGSQPEEADRLLDG